MQKKRSPFMLVVIGLVIAALLAVDMLPALGREAALPMPVATAADDGRVLVAQEEPAQRPRKRRTLMDLLFGDDEKKAQDEAPVVQKPVVKKQVKAVLPPAVPAIEKAAGATRLAVFGDSMAVDVGKALERFYAEDPNLAVITQGVGSSGLVRADFFDWPKTITEQIAANSFDIAIVIVGVNDRQKMNIDGTSFGSLTPEWTVQYSARVTGIVQQLRTANKPTIWIGLPPMEPPKFAQTMLGINEIQRLAVFGGGAEYLDIYERFANDEGKYTSRGPDLNGTQVRMRKDDGIHFSTAGADKLAFYLSQSLKTYYRGGGTVGIEVADALFGTDAQLMVRPPYQGLGQMKLLEVAGAVISLTHTPRRAAELVTAELTEVTPVGFNMDALIEAPVGRADAFWVGKVPAATNPSGR